MKHTCPQLPTSYLFTQGKAIKIEPETLKIKKLSEKGKLPTRESKSAAGLDIYSAENAIVTAGSHWLVHTDIAMEIPPGHYGQCKPRSRLALKHGITVDAGDSKMFGSPS